MIESENFLLELSPSVYEEDFSSPVNIRLGIKVSSYGFSADSVMDTGIREMTDFVMQLKEMYEKLNGSAELSEPYGISYVKFLAKAGGHISVWGRISNKSSFGFEQELTFDNEIDQTYIKDFVYGLCSDFEKYCQ